jgi:hypothetical protein
MKKTALILVIASIVAASAVQAEVNVNVNLGVPVPRVVVTPPAPPRVVVSVPPAVLFDVAPHFIAPSRLGFYVGIDTPYDIFFNADYYYLYYGNSWHRARHHNGPWVEIPYRELPAGIRKHRIEQIRSYRDQEYRVYRADRDHYRGRYFRADHNRKEEWKDERRHDREEFRDERRRDREEWKDEKRDREHGRHGRD